MLLLRAPKYSFRLLPHLLPAVLITILGFMIHQSTASPDTFIYVGCSPMKYSSSSKYESNVNSLMTSLVNAASYFYYNNFTIGSGSTDVVYGLFQCRHDISNPDCGNCVSHSVSQLGVLCPNSVGGALQLDGCFVKYDNSTFLGVEDKTLVANKCGPQKSGNGDLTQIDSVLSYLATGNNHDQLFRVRQSGVVTGVAQCVGDLSATECQDCLEDAIDRLRTSCGGSTWGDVFLAKCYARFYETGSPPFSQTDSIQDNETEKTLAILIGIIAAAVLLVIFLAFFRKLCEGEEDHGK